VKIFKFVLVLLVMAANLVFVPPSWADAPKTPKYASNPDYIEVTQALNTLRTAKDAPNLAQTYTPEQL
jgi:predicted mannosyl-3-phosphoglycerate phosphatase (HAD superfamily)